VMMRIRIDRGKFRYFDNVRRFCTASLSVSQSYLRPPLKCDLHTMRMYPNVSELAVWSENCKMVQLSATRCSCFAIF
jgi:hypothetical protein